MYVCKCVCVCVCVCVCACVCACVCVCLTVGCLHSIALSCPLSFIHTHTHPHPHPHTHTHILTYIHTPIHTHTHTHTHTISLDAGPSAVFYDLPPAPLLTLGMDAAPAWMVQSIESRYDLDNIHLATATKGVKAVFELEYILIEGSCTALGNNSPLRSVAVFLKS